MMRLHVDLGVVDAVDAEVVVDEDVAAAGAPREVAQVLLTLHLRQ